MQKPPYFDRVVAPFRFEEPLRMLLHEFKYKASFYLSTFFAASIQNLISQPIITECLIPVPMHPKRLKQKGFNQSQFLAKTLASTLNIPCDTSICRKIIYTPPQTQLDKKERQRNLRGAFQVSASSYQHVTIVDDLVTTGSTANEIAKVLKQSGVQQVDVWCCARVAL